MAGLDPDFAAAPSRGGLQRCPGRQSEPREWGELLAAFGKAAVQNEQFDPAGNGHPNSNARRPALQQNKFAHGYYQNHRLSDHIYERMRARWGDKGVVD